MLEDIPRPVLSHLAELRRRLLRVALACAAVFTAVTAVPSMERSLAVRFFSLAAASLLPPGAKLVFLDPLEPLWVALKASCALTAALVGPYALAQALSFAAPALESGSRRLLWASCLAAGLLFTAGAAAAWFVLIPSGLKLFFALGAAAGAEPMIGSDRFFSFVVTMLFVFGLPFELPLVLALLMRAGVVAPDTLRRVRRPAYLGILILAAVITPDPTPFSQLILTAILIGLYEAAILAAPLLVIGRAETGDPGGLRPCPTSE